LWSKLYNLISLLREKTLDTSKSGKYPDRFKIGAVASFITMHTERAAARDAINFRIRMMRNLRSGHQCESKHHRVLREHNVNMFRASAPKILSSGRFFASHCCSADTTDIRMEMYEALPAAGSHVVVPSWTYP
jgi:hypothetical protein